jgi:hypothetical protein
MAKCDHSDLLSLDEMPSASVEGTSENNDYTLEIKGKTIYIPNTHLVGIGLICSMIDINGYPMYKSLKRNGPVLDQVIKKQILTVLLETESESNFKNEITRELLELN